MTLPALDGAILYAKKSDGSYIALEITDDGLLKVDTEINATLDPTGLATQVTLASILEKLPSDPATQTTLAAILAKIIAGPATEAKQTALQALVGEVQANPTQNTLLARVKDLLSGIVLAAGANAIGKTITPSFSVSDSVTRPANTTAYAANKSINCSVAVTAMSYSGLTVTLTANNAFAVGDRITVAGVNSGFSATNIDGNWICKTGTNATTVVFDVLIQPTGTTPQTVSAGTIAKCMSLDLAGVAGAGVIISRISVALPGVGMTGSVRLWGYSAQPTVLVDQATFTLLVANDAYRRFYVDLYPVTSGSGSNMNFTEWVGWMVYKPEAADTRLYLRLETLAAGTPASAGVVTVRASGVQLLG